MASRKGLGLGLGLGYSGFVQMRPVSFDLKRNYSAICVPIFKILTFLGSDGHLQSFCASPFLIAMILNFGKLWVLIVGFEPSSGKFLTYFCFFLLWTSCHFMTWVPISIMPSRAIYVTQSGFLQGSSV